MGKNCVERRPCCGEIANFNRRMMSCVMSGSGVSPKSRRSALVTLWCGYFPFCLCRIFNYECNRIAMCARGVFITGGCFWATGGWGTNEILNEYLVPKMTEPIVNPRLALF